MGTDNGKDKKLTPFEIMGMNRHTRRLVGKANGGLKIPGITKPFVNENKDKSGDK